MTLIHRRDPAKNMARFYLVDTHADLFGGTSLLREWGRIGRARRVKAESHPDELAAEQAAERLTARKRQRGYR